MTEVDNAEQLVEEKSVLSFGEHLSTERKRQNISVAEVAESIHLSENIIDAIERSDISQLPQPTFVQGYLRAYAKYLDVSEALVLEGYAQTVLPHDKETELQPRHSYPNEMNSNAPLVKMVTILLLVMMVVAALYASFDYYKSAIQTDEAELDNQTSLSLSESELTDQSDIEYDIPSEQAGVEQDIQADVEQDVQAGVEQDIQADVEQDVQAGVEQDIQADVGQDIQTEVGQDIQTEVGQDIVEQEILVNTAAEMPELTAVVSTENVPSKVVQENTANQKPVNQLVVEGDDFLEVFAAEASWLEVDDANGENLYYSLLDQDQQITLKGTAPFRVFLGNAPHVKIKMNDVSVYVEKYIRSNNIALFKISVDQQQVVFH